MATLTTMTTVNGAVEDSPYVISWLRLSLNGNESTTGPATTNSFSITSILAGSTLEYFDGSSGRWLTRTPRTARLGQRRLSARDIAHTQGERGSDAAIEPRVSLRLRDQPR